MKAHELPVGAIYKMPAQEELTLGAVVRRWKTAALDEWLFVDRFGVPLGATNITITTDAGKKYRRRRQAGKLVALEVTRPTEPGVINNLITPGLTTRYDGDVVLFLDVDPETVRRIEHAPSDIAYLLSIIFDRGVC